MNFFSTNTNSKTTWVQACGSEFSEGTVHFISHFHPYHQSPEPAQSNISTLYLNEVHICLFHPARISFQNSDFMQEAGGGGCPSLLPDLHVFIFNPKSKSLNPSSGILGMRVHTH